MIFLDFDGVLFDSAREAFEVAFRTWFGGRNIEGKAEAWNEFRRLRPSIWNAWHYRTVMQGIESGLTGEDALNAVREVVANEPNQLDLKFEQEFFSCRKELIALDREGWLRMSPPYPFFRKIAPLLSSQPNAFCILSTRNESSIRALLGLYLDEPFPEVIGATAMAAAGGEKAKVIRSMLASGETGLFVDDCRAHLDMAWGIEGLVLMEAGWGYVELAAMNDNADEVEAMVMCMIRRCDGASE